MTTQLIESFGFRSIVNGKYQSWGGFTGLLFREDELRGEFDVVEFNFDTDFAIEDVKFIQDDYSDDMSLDAAYFGRAIDHTIFNFPKIITLEKQLTHIKDMISSFFNDTGKNKLSEPILIISDISDTKICAYYIWQFK
jgi:hypothetical protein